MPTESTLIERLKALQCFYILLLYRGLIHTRVNPMVARGDFITTKFNVGVPLFKGLEITKKAAASISGSKEITDDDELGRTAFSVIDWLPFEQCGALLLTLTTICGIVLPPAITGAELVERVRLLYTNLTFFDVHPKFAISLSQGAWGPWRNDRAVAYIDTTTDFTMLINLDAWGVMPGDNDKLIWSGLLATILTCLNLSGESLLAGRGGLIFKRNTALVPDIVYDYAEHDKFNAYMGLHFIASGGFSVDYVKDEEWTRQKQTFVPRDMKEHPFNTLDRNFPLNSLDRRLFRTVPTERLGVVVPGIVDEKTKEQIRSNFNYAEYLTLLPDLLDWHRKLKEGFAFKSLTQVVPEGKTKAPSQILKPVRVPANIKKPTIVVNPPAQVAKTKRVKAQQPKAGEQRVQYETLKVDPDNRAKYASRGIQLVVGLLIDDAAIPRCLCRDANLISLDRAQKQYKAKAWDEVQAQIQTDVAATWRSDFCIDVVEGGLLYY